MFGKTRSTKTAEVEKTWLLVDANPRAFHVLTALLPAMCAALVSIRVQGDFKTSAQQSERTAIRLEAIDYTLAEEFAEFCSPRRPFRKNIRCHDGRGMTKGLSDAAGTSARQSATGWSPVGLPTAWARKSRMRK